jgi:hypothetical protein
MTGSFKQAMKLGIAYKAVNIFTSLMVICFSEFNINFNATFSFTPKSPKRSLSFRFSDQNFKCSSHLSYVCFMP